MRSTSKQLFGKRYRLEIAAQFGAASPPLFARRLAAGLDLAENQLTPEISLLSSLGALERTLLPGDRRKLYRVLPHPLWPFVRGQLEHSVRELEPERGGELLAAYWAAVLDGEGPVELAA